MVVFEDATANSAICMKLNKTAKDTWLVDSCASFHLMSLRSAYVEYRRGVGSLIWLATRTRPDLSRTAEVLS